MPYEIIRKERNHFGYFTLYWSPIEKADKYSIVTKVPAVGGIIELYYLDDKKKLNLFMITRSWYGGLRSTLREHTDPILEEDPYRLSILEKYKDSVYYRYSMCESHPDMIDVVFFLSETYASGSPGTIHSGRYEKIFLNEIDGNKMVTI